MADEQPPPPPWQSVKDAMRMREARSKDGKAVSNAPIRAYTKLQDLPLEEQKARRREQKRVSEQKRRDRVRREEAEARRKLGEEEAERQQQRQQQQLQQQHEQKRRDRVRREEAEARRKLGEEEDEQQQQQQHGALRAPSAVPQQQQPQSAAPHAAHTTHRDPSAHNAVRRVNDDDELQDSLSSFPGPPIALKQQQQQQQLKSAPSSSQATIEEGGEDDDDDNDDDNDDDDPDESVRGNYEQQQQQPRRTRRAAQKTVSYKEAPDSDEDEQDESNRENYEPQQQQQQPRRTRRAAQELRRNMEAPDSNKAPDNNKLKAEAFKAMPSVKDHGISPFNMLREAHESCKNAKDYDDKFPPRSLSLGHIGIRGPDDLSDVPGKPSGTIFPSKVLEPHWNGKLPSPKGTCYFGDKASNYLWLGHSVRELLEFANKAERQWVRFRLPLYAYIVYPKNPAHEYIRAFQQSGLSGCAYFTQLGGSVLPDEVWKGTHNGDGTYTWTKIVQRFDNV